MLTVAAVVAAIVGLPLAASIATQRAMMSFGEEEAANIARSVLARSDRITDKLQSALEYLETRRGSDPCSPSNIDAMRSIALNSADIMLVGFTQNDALLCSSYGVHPGGLPMGPVDFVGIYKARRDVQLSVAPSASFFAVERNGWTFFLSRTQPIDVPANKSMSLATYSTNVRQIRNTQGYIRPGWMDAGRSGQAITFVDDGYVVAVLESARHASGAIAAIPVGEFKQSHQTIETITEITSALAGGSIAGWIVYFAMRNRSLTSLSLRRALRKNEFYLVYQPIVDVQTRRWIGAEALLRWRRGEGKEIPPDVFIAAAEKMGVVEEFTQRVLDLAAQDSRTIFSQSDNFYLSLNLTAADVKSNAIVDRLKELLTRAHSPPSRFKVEITERSVLDTSAAETAIAQIHALGIDTIIDDFGTGFSNLKYLTTFKFDYLKIDRAFVQGIGTNAVTGEVAFHIIAIARSLGIGVIAEGVEDETQARILQERGVTMAQGWLYARPRTVDHLIEGLHAPADKT